ncbi:unnamed protein product [Rotaria socialis]|uniref:Uncharacterized protein n=2 Tax=Rotaria socialis TaxID=392032 RepID=A0A818VXU2_9BILA|nr:unnamed protein product [Rotaria socialis]CAF3330140.1 unnamed protein product [Rotaria socialis]CAF3423482.1 unnamed protein product [Rotaria socialis]CAF3580660.1 unnamed protein product [Rotaria socialis]CAF3717670.1 unnamed protein product [Rotaria socialis]
MIPSNGHTCDGGNRTLRWSQFCDGIIDCHDRFDEEGHFCKHCVNNLYSCPPEDDIRCDLACNMLRYVPCQMIQDRRACNSIQSNYDQYSPYHLLKNFYFYIAVAIATVAMLLIITGIILLIKYLTRTYQRRITRSSAKTVYTPSAPAPPPSYLSTLHNRAETDTLSSHIYEECYAPPPYEKAHKYPMTRRYYEHAL